MEGQSIAVVSGKGGTGKTSFVACVGAALALGGRRVLCIDCDVGLRNLDIALGLSDEALMDFTDVAQGRCSLEDAVVAHPRLKGLGLLTAPTKIRARPVTAQEMRQVLAQAASLYDYCFLDAPAGLGTVFQMVSGAVERCVVVTTTDASSLRDAQHTVMELSRFPAGSIHLVVNRVRRRMLAKLHATIDDAIDQAGLPLLGVVPEDDALPLSQNRGEPLVLTGGQGAAQAYRNIAKRLQGERVPLMRIK